MRAEASMNEKQAQNQHIVGEVIHTRQMTLNLIHLMTTVNQVDLFREVEVDLMMMMA
jgi:hypothetical protein